jgi:hypothetical protein
MAATIIGTKGAFARKVEREIGVSCKVPSPTRVECCICFHIRRPRSNKDHQSFQSHPFFNGLRIERISYSEGQLLVYHHIRYSTELIFRNQSEPACRTTPLAISGSAVKIKKGIQE